MTAWGNVAMIDAAELAQLRADLAAARELIGLYEANQVRDERLIAAARNAALKKAAAVCVDRGRMSIIGRHYQRAEAEQDCSDAILALIKEDAE